MQFTLLAFLASAALTTAHFTLDYPYTTGYYYLQEVNAPCGGFPPDLSNLTAYPLEGGEVAFDLHHPYALFLIRAQLVGMNSWVNLSNGFILQNGLGEGCVNAGPVPGNWSGQAGVIQVVGQPPDDILYQVPPKFHKTKGSVLVCCLHQVHLEPRVFVSTDRELLSTTPPNLSLSPISASFLRELKRALMSLLLIQQVVPQLLLLLLLALRPRVVLRLSMFIWE